jgi:hypothetical protein
MKAANQCGSDRNEKEMRRLPPPQMLTGAGPVNLADRSKNANIRH